MGKIRHTGTYSRDVVGTGDATEWVQPPDVAVAVPWKYARKAWTAQKYADDDYTFSELANVDPSLADRNTSTRTWVQRDGWEGWAPPSDPDTSVAGDAMSVAQVGMEVVDTPDGFATLINQTTRAYTISIAPSAVPEPSAPTPPPGYEVQYEGGQYVDFATEVRWSTVQQPSGFVAEGTPYAQHLCVEPNIPFYSKPDALLHWPTPEVASAWNEVSTISKGVKFYANYEQDAHRATATFSTLDSFDLTIISDWYKNDAPPAFPPGTPGGSDVFRTYARVDGIQITGTYRPRRYRYVRIVGRGSYVATEHGQGVVGLYEVGQLGMRVTMHDANAPAAPIATALATIDDRYEPTFSLYLGGGRSVVVVASTGYFPEDSEIRTVSYRDGELTVGPPLLLGAPEGGGGSIQRLFAYAISGARFRAVGQLYSGESFAADFTVDPAGGVQREAPWRPVDVDLRGPGGGNSAWCVVSAGKLFVLGDRIRRHDWETFALEATSDFTAPPNVQTSYGQQDGFGHAVLGPDGRLKVFAITVKSGSAGSSQLPIDHVDLWSINLGTLQRTVRRLNPPEAGSAGGVTVPGWPDIWNISWPPSGNSNSYRGALGDQRSRMGTILAVYGLAYIGAPKYGSSAGVLSSADDSVGVVTRQVGQGGTGAPEAIFYTRDNYAVTLDSRGSYSYNNTFWATGPVLPPDDTLRPLAAFKQGFYS